MHYVLLRDDDTNALTPVERLEQLYRPFLDRGLPVNLSTIPQVRTDTCGPDGTSEEFLMAREAGTPSVVSLASSAGLVRYLRDNPGFHLLQHGCHHSLFEFGTEHRSEARNWLEQGAAVFAEAGLPEPEAFVAPYDRFSGASLAEVAARFRIISGGWYELRRLPLTWWPHYLGKKIGNRSHWKIGRTLLLTHPGCLLSHRRPYHNMLDSVKQCVESRQVTVLVTHWWEYFRQGATDQAMLGILHETAEWLAGCRNVRVISFRDLIRENLPLN